MHHGGIKRKPCSAGHQPKNRGGTKWQLCRKSIALDKSAFSNGLDSKIRLQGSVIKKRRETYLLNCKTLRGRGRSDQSPKKKTVACLAPSGIGRKNTELQHTQRGGDMLVYYLGNIPTGCQTGTATWCKPFCPSEPKNANDPTKRCN